jgi:hypothetical protein
MCRGDYSFMLGNVTTPEPTELIIKKKTSIMKKFLFAIAVLVASGSYAAPSSTNKLNSGDGIHISTSQVPTRILNAFKAAYPNATRVEWEKELEHGSTEYKVSFYVNGSKMRIRYR